MDIRPPRLLTCFLVGLYALITGAFAYANGTVTVNKNDCSVACAPADTNVVAVAANTVVNTATVPVADFDQLVVKSANDPAAFTQNFANISAHDPAASITNTGAVSINRQHNSSDPATINANTATIGALTNTTTSQYAITTGEIGNTDIGANPARSLAAIRSTTGNSPALVDTGGTATSDTSTANIRRTTGDLAKASIAKARTESSA